jgi:hypothetical protein
MAMRAAVVEAIIVVPSVTRTNLYNQLQCGEDSEYGRKAYNDYFEVFHVLRAEDDKSLRPTSKNF